jgi:hypothetical protein
MKLMTIANAIRNLSTKRTLEPMYPPRSKLEVRGGATLLAPGAALFAERKARNSLRSLRRELRENP